MMVRFFSSEGKVLQNLVHLLSLFGGAVSGRVSRSITQWKPLLAIPSIDANRYSTISGSEHLEGDPNKWARPSGATTPRDSPARAGFARARAAGIRAPATPLGPERALPGSKGLVFAPKPRKRFCAALVHNEKHVLCCVQVGPDLRWHFACVPRSHVPA